MKINQGRSRRRLPAPALAALMGATSLVAATQASMPAFASPPSTDPSSESTVDLVARVSPSVVTIEVTKAAQPADDKDTQVPGGFPFDEFARRFGMPMPGMPGWPHGGSPEMQGVGTGFIISEDGEIVTNAHVVDGADTVTVSLGDGRTFDAKVLGIDDATDIAVLDIEADGLPAVQFGDSTALRVGEDVIAMGNPFGLGNTVTTGIVSGLGRDINAGPLDHFIQTDAAINRGNSGGPLFNESGEVVGINTAILSPSGGSVGVGFAVPSEIAADVVADLAEDGQVERGWLGIQIQPVNEDVVAALGLDAAKGAMIMDVTADTPADGAGLKKGDIVLSVDGTVIDNPRTLTRIIAGNAPGTEVTLSLLRGGHPIDVSVTLGNRADGSA